MEVQNLRSFTAESESMFERNAAADDEYMSIGDGEIVGEGQLGESAFVEMISKKKRRGRPRKYVADGLKKSPPVSPQGSFSSSADSQIISKRRLGRPPGSGRLQLLASLGGFAWETAGGSFTPHVLHIAEGEDIVNRLSKFTRKGPRAICIISAVGLVSTVLLHHPDSELNTILRFQGMFEILRLSGSFIGEMNGNCTKEGQICISLAKPDGRVFGGVVASSLIAATPIQIIVGSFKQKLSNAVKKLHTPGYSSSQPSGTEEEEEGEEEEEEEGEEEEICDGSQ